MEEIGIFFEYNNLVAQIPVNPEKIEIGFSSSNKTLEVVKLGEINLLKKKKLETIKFESFFPYDYWFHAIRTKGQFESVKFYKDFFERIMDEAKPVRLIITGIGYSNLVSIEDFEYNHTAGDEEDCHYSISMKRYQPFSVQTVVPVIMGENGYIINPNPSQILGAQGGGSSYQSGKGPVIAPSKITVGTSVTITGVLKSESTGGISVNVTSGLKARVSYIKRNDPYPYHLCDYDGNWLGFASEKELKLT